MVLLIVSDLHYEKGKYKGLDESGSFKNFVKLVRRSNADNIVVLGDIGHAWRSENFDALADTGAKFYFIYGNHDVVPLMKQAKNKDGTNMLMEDGAVIETDGFVLAFINGVAGNTKLEEGMDKKEVDNFEKIAKDIKSKVEQEHSKNSENLVLLTHAGPTMDSMLPLTRRSKSFSQASSPSSEAVNRAIEITKPFLSISGHVKFTGLGTHNYNDSSTIVVKVQTSTLEGTYALLDKHKLIIGSIYNNITLPADRWAFSVDLKDLRRIVKDRLPITYLLLPEYETNGAIESSVAKVDQKSDLSSLERQPNPDFSNSSRKENKMINIR